MENWTKAASAQLQQGIASAPKTAFSELTDQLSSIHNRLLSEISRIGNLADRYFGAQPSATNGGGPTPVPNGAIAEVVSKLENIRSALDSLSQQITRLEVL
jgi:hypothetical protein